MGIFIGDRKNTNAATSALKIKYAVTNIIKPKAEAYFTSLSKTSWEIDHSVGVDTSSILAVRAGQRGSNDLIWVGRSPNLAAKLSEIRDPYYKSYISEDVYEALNDTAKKGGEKDQDMWTKCSYNWIGVSWIVYKSSWWWKL
jgi:adenylate cyclase